MRDLKSLTVEDRFRLAAAAVAALGLGAAAVVRFTTEETVLATIDRSRTAAMQLQLERYGGKFAVMSAEISDWFDRLWQGRQLATTLAVVTVVTVGLLLWIGHLASDGPRREP